MRAPVFAALFLGLALASCGAGAPQPAEATTTLTVRGPAAEVERFIEAQAALNPGLVATGTDVATAGQSEVTVTLPPSADGHDLTEMSKAAIEARLSVAVSSRG